MIQREDAQCVHTLIPTKLYTLLHGFETLSRDYGNNHPMLPVQKLISHRANHLKRSYEHICSIAKTLIFVRISSFWIWYYLLRAILGKQWRTQTPKQNKQWWWSTCKNQFLREPRECSKSTIIHNKTRKLHHKNYIWDLNTFLARWHVYPSLRLCVQHETIWTRDLRCRRSHGMDA